MRNDSEGTCFMWLAQPKCRTYVLTNRSEGGTGLVLTRFDLVLLNFRMRLIGLVGQWEQTESTGSLCCVCASVRPGLCL